MGISKIDPTLSIEKLQTMTESQFFDRKSARLAPKDFSHQLSGFANLAEWLYSVSKITGMSQG